MMLLHIIARGKIARTPEAEIVARYEKRIPWPVHFTELADSGGKMPVRAGHTRVVLVDERGQNLSSEEFAALIGRWRDEGVRETRFLIGAADGHEAAAREEADVAIAFGKATWPHLLVRAMLAEQLYRAASILSGHPYHRA